MASSPSHQDPASSQEYDGNVQHERTPNATPRWVKVSVGIVILLVLLFVILHLTGNGFGPSMHMSIIEYGVQPQ